MDQALVLALYVLNGQNKEAEGENSMKKRVCSLLLALVLCVSLTIPGFAASDTATATANKLNELGLFNAVGNHPDGTPNYDLDRRPNRMESVTLPVRLLGKEADAKAGNRTTPFIGTKTPRKGRL